MVIFWFGIPAVEWQIAYLDRYAREKQSIQGIVMQVVDGDDATERKLKWTPFIPDICHIPIYRRVGQRCIFNFDISDACSPFRYSTVIQKVNL